MRKELKVGDQIKISSWVGADEDITLGRIYTICKHRYENNIGFLDNVREFRYAWHIEGYTFINRIKPIIKPYGIVAFMERTTK